MKNKIIILSFLLVGCGHVPTAQHTMRSLNNCVIVENSIFKVWYNEIYEQPIRLIYTATNREKNVDRGSMSFHVEPAVHTSDNYDYKNNIWDKGHIAPAASYSDSEANLYSTFSFLNCTLQHESLNRGQWRILEEQERAWDDVENLTIVVDLMFDAHHIILPTGAHVPTKLIKHIYFDDSKIYKCFEFKNDKPVKNWKDHEVDHYHKAKLNLN